MFRRVFPFSVLGVLVIAIALATVIEHQQGTERAFALVYASLWFKVLWGIVVVSGAYLLYVNRIWRHFSVMLLHLSLIIILAGALTTHLTGMRGFLQLRIKDASQTFWVEESKEQYISHTMPFLVCLKDFRVEYDPGHETVADYVSELLLVTPEGEQAVTVSMNRIATLKGYRIYQTSYDEDLQGSVFTVSYDPWGTPITYVGYALLALGMIGCALPKRKRNAESDKAAPTENTPRWVTVLMTCIGILLASYMVIAIGFSPLMPVLRSPLLFVHVGTIMVAYVLLVVCLVKRSVLKPAVFMLATGIFLGAIWANISWGSYWSWDPKESWAIITLIVYSIPLHTKTLPWFKSDRNFRLYCLFGLLCLLMTYFGVNYLLGGMHSYMQ